MVSRAVVARFGMHAGENYRTPLRHLPVSGSELPVLTLQIELDPVHPLHRLSVGVGAGIMIRISVLMEM